MWRSLQYALSFLAVFALVGQTSLPVLAQQAATGQTEARFAFIIGNDDYEGAPLKTAANDAGLIAETLRSTGFDITGARNLDQDTLRASFREFVRKVEAAGPNTVSAIYLSGYGVQVEGENYLVPANTNIARDSDVILNGVRLSDFTRALAAVPSRAHLVMFDLAYDSPFAKQGQPIAPGLSLVEPEQNVLVSFNAAPGMYAPKPEGDYGPYAQALAEMLRIAGLPLNEVFPRVRTRTAELSNGAQLPWSAARIDDQILLVARAADAPAPAFDVREIREARKRPLRDFSAEEAYSAALDRDTFDAYEEFLAIYPDSPFAKNVRGILAARREALTWERTVRANTAAAYWSYLDRYPKGPHAADARRKLARLAAPVQPPASYTAFVYDVPPPPPAEIIIIEEPRPVYIVSYMPPPRAYYMPPPPVWYQPPPPPPIDYYSDVYYLPVTPAPPPPPWWSPPRYVVAPPVYDSRPGINPYVAIPAALAAGIVAGKLLSDRRARIATQPANVAPTTTQPLTAPLMQQQQQQTTTAPTARTTALPPTATPPRTMNQLVNQQGLPQSQVQAPVPTSTQQPGTQTPGTRTAPRTGTQPPAQQSLPGSRGAPLTAPQQGGATQTPLQQQQQLPGARTAPPPSGTQTPTTTQQQQQQQQLPGGRMAPLTAPQQGGTAPAPTQQQQIAPSRGAPPTGFETQRPQQGTQTPNRSTTQSPAPQLMEQQKAGPGARTAPSTGAQTPPPSQQQLPGTRVPTSPNAQTPQQQQRFAPNTQPPQGNMRNPYQRPMTTTPNPPQQRLAPNTAPSYTPPTQRSAPTQSAPPAQQQRPSYTPPPAAQRPRPAAPAPMMQQQRPSYTPPPAASQPRPSAPAPVMQQPRPSSPPPAQQPAKRNCGGPGQPKCN